MQIPSEIRTIDLYVAAFLALHLDMDRIDKTNPAKKVFVFLDPDEEAGPLLNSWDNRSAEVNATDYADSLRNLKSAVMRDRD